MRHRPHVSRCKAWSRHSCVELSRACELIPAPLQWRRQELVRGGHKTTFPTAGDANVPLAWCELSPRYDSFDRTFLYNLLQSCRVLKVQVLNLIMLQKWSMRPQLGVFWLLFLRILVIYHLLDSVVIVSTCVKKTIYLDTPGPKR